MILYGVGSCVESLPRTSGRRHNVEIIQEGKQRIVWVQGGCRTVQHFVLPQCKQRGGKSVALLAALALLDFPEAPAVVPPAVDRWLAMEHADEREELRPGATSRSLDRKANRDMQS